MTLYARKIAGAVSTIVAGTAVMMLLYGRIGEMPSAAPAIYQMYRRRKSTFSFSE